MVIKVAVD